jgi:hypothetical protein
LRNSDIAIPIVNSMPGLSSILRRTEPSPAV